MIFHVANSWQEGKDREIIKLFACCFEEVDPNPTLSWFIRMGLPSRALAVLCLRSVLLSITAQSSWNDGPKLYLACLQEGASNALQSDPDTWDQGTSRRPCERL